MNFFIFISALHKSRRRWCRRSLDRFSTRREDFNARPFLAPITWYRGDTTRTIKYSVKKKNQRLRYDILLRSRRINNQFPPYYKLTIYLLYARCSENEEEEEENVLCKLLTPRRGKRFLRVYLYNNINLVESSSER